MLVLEMGCSWHSTESLLEAGIDGLIELRDRETHVMLNHWIGVQCKATAGRFDHEDDSSFLFRCDRRDLRYWLDGNIPVILVVSRPRNREAWWVPLDDRGCPARRGISAAVR